MGGLQAIIAIMPETTTGTRAPSPSPRCLKMRNSRAFASVLSPASRPPPPPSHEFPASSPSRSRRPRPRRLFDLLPLPSAVQSPGSAANRHRRREQSGDAPTLTTPPRASRNVMLCAGAGDAEAVGGHVRPRENGHFQVSPRLQQQRSSACVRFFPMSLGSLTCDE